jgi:hypothetical protein
MGMFIKQYGLGADEAVVVQTSTPGSMIYSADSYACRSNKSCIPLFQTGTADKDGKCGCEFQPESAMMGAFFLPIMPALYLIQNQCGELGRGGGQGIDGKPPTTICKTLNSYGMILPALGLTVLGWYWIYKATIGK